MYKINVLALEYSAYLISDVQTNLNYHRQGLYVA